MFAEGYAGRVKSFPMGPSGNVKLPSVAVSGQEDTQITMSLKGLG